MSRLAWPRLVPQTALGQIVAIIVGALGMTFSVGFGLVVMFRPLIPPPPVGPMENALAVSAVVRALQAAPPAAWAAIALAVTTRHFEVTIASGRSPCAENTPRGKMMTGLLDRVMEGDAVDFVVSECREPSLPGNGEVQVLVPLPPAQIEIRITERAPSGVLALAVPTVVALFFLLVAVTVLSIWAAWRIIRPLRRLADTVEAFGQDIVAAPVAESGPREIRQVAIAFNRMQEAIAAFVSDRSRMLAAIGHDLRTPLTRLKLRVSLEPAGETRDKMLRDVQQLHVMIDSALAFLKGQTGVEAKDWIDLNALIATVCDEFGELGSPIGHGTGLALPCLCQPLAMRRALTNLIENARAHGTTVWVTARQEPASLIIEVTDDGPGIADADKERALQPFARLDNARASTDGNVGLGLAIVVDVVRAHGGGFHLLDRTPHGLVARLSLPRTLA